MNANPTLQLPQERKPLLTVKTLKNWVLPPRPKNARKSKNSDSKKATSNHHHPNSPPLISNSNSNSRSTTSRHLPISLSPSSSPPVSSTPSLKNLPPKDSSHINEFPQHCNYSAKPLRSQNAPPPPPLVASFGTSKPLDVKPSPDLAGSIKIIDDENYQLKMKLLSLINDYKRVKSHLANPSPDLNHLHLVDSATPTSTRKRSYIEIDPMNELISNMNHLSHRSPSDMDILEESIASPCIDDLLSLPEPACASMKEEEVATVGGAAAATDLSSFVNLDTELEDVLPDEDFDDEELDSTLLSRSTSPGYSETDGESLLMNSLTRSTTVSTNNSSIPEKRHHVNPMLDFYDLPSYSDQDYAFNFEDINPHDKMLSVIEEDHYNQVADFLAEKLLSNDVKYYVEKGDGSMF